MECTPRELIGKIYFIETKKRFIQIEVEIKKRKLGRYILALPENYIVYLLSRAIEKHACKWNEKILHKSLALNMGMYSPRYGTVISLRLIVKQIIYLSLMKIP